MKIKVYAPSFCDQRALDESSGMELPDDSTVGDVYKRLKIPILYRPIVVCAVNHEVAKSSKKLKDGDVISFFMPTVGG